MAEYIERISLLNGISSPEADYSEIIEELIYKHKLDFLHDNNEDGVRDFASDLIECIRNYIKTEPTTDVVEVKHGEWIDRYKNKYYNKLYVCSECGGEALLESYKNVLDQWNERPVLTPFCPHCGAKMDGGNLSEKPTGCEGRDER